MDKGLVIGQGENPTVQTMSLVGDIEYAFGGKLSPLVRRRGKKAVSAPHVAAIGDVEPYFSKARCIQQPGTSGIVIRTVVRQTIEKTLRGE
jgi:hypothetical protein